MSNCPSGKIAGNATELTVRTFGRLYTEEDFSNVIIRSSADGDIRIKDVGEAVLGPENEESVLRESNIPMVGLGIIPLPGSNYVEISDEFYKKLDQIKKDMPEDIKLNISMDQTIFIKRSISEVEETLVISFLLVVLVIYLFFRDYCYCHPSADRHTRVVARYFLRHVFVWILNQRVDYVGYRTRYRSCG